MVTSRLVVIAIAREKLPLGILGCSSNSRKCGGKLHKVGAIPTQPSLYLTTDKGNIMKILPSNGFWGKRSGTYSDVYGFIFRQRQWSSGNSNSSKKRKDTKLIGVPHKWFKDYKN